MLRARAHLICVVILAAAGAAAGDSNKTFAVPIHMDQVTVEGNDIYMETSIELPTRAAHIVRFEPQAEMSVVHHMLLYLCTGGAAIPTHKNVGSVGMHSKCKGKQMLIYGWGRNAHGLVLPDGVGYRIGGASGFTHAVLEVHYLTAQGGINGGDSSGVVMHLTYDEQPFEAGILMFATGFVIPARNPNYHVAMDCCYDGPEALTAIAFRVHTHARGRLVWMDQISRGVASRALQRSPLLPQAFNMVSEQGTARNPGPEEGGGDEYVNEPLPGPLVIRPGTHLQATCRFNASESPTDILAGPTHDHEMCNLYLQYYATTPVSMACYGKDTKMSYDLGPQPFVFGGGAAWPLAPMDKGFAPLPGMGQVGGTAFAPDGRSVYVFHRGGRPWGPNSLKVGTVDYEVANETAIGDDTVVEMDVGSGTIVRSWGSGLFNCPHGITTDSWGNVWVTDTGLHQVLKFSADGTLLLSVGKRLKPGHDSEHLCAPTAVAVSADGSFFVADGYCNNRVVAFTRDGAFAGEWSPPADSPAGGATMQVVHSLALDECAGLLYVADRERGRVFVLENINLANPPASWKVQRTIDLSATGAVYALSRVSGGSVFALCWQQPAVPQALASAAAGSKLATILGPKAMDGKVSLVRLHPSQAEAPAAGDTWEVPAVKNPHALALHTGPGGQGLVVRSGVQNRIRMSVRKPIFHVFIGETRPEGTESKLHRIKLGTVQECRWEGGCTEPFANFPVRPFGHLSRSWKKLSFMTGGGAKGHDERRTTARKLGGGEE